jgi:hypothetical protein
MEAEVLTAAFARQVLTGRWFTLFACLLILSALGATYAFGVYSPLLKSALGYDQRAVATLAFFKDLGSNVGVPVGLLNEVAPPWVVLAVGTAMNLPLSGRVAVVRNFPEQGRDAVLGLAKGYVGLSSAALPRVVRRRRQVARRLAPRRRLRRFVRQRQSARSTAAGGRGRVLLPALHLRRVHPPHDHRAAAGHLLARRVGSRARLPHPRPCSSGRSTGSRRRSKMQEPEKPLK